jgi:hypothetical protein
MNQEAHIRTNIHLMSCETIVNATLCYLHCLNHLHPVDTTYWYIMHNRLAVIHCLNQLHPVDMTYWYIIHNGLALRLIPISY